MKVNSYDIKDHIRCDGQKVLDPSEKMGWLLCEIHLLHVELRILHEEPQNHAAPDVGVLPLPILRVQPADMRPLRDGNPERGLCLEKFHWTCDCNTVSARMTSIYGGAAKSGGALKISFLLSK